MPQLQHTVATVLLEIAYLAAGLLLCYLALFVMLRNPDDRWVLATESFVERLRSGIATLAAVQESARR